MKKLSILAMLLAGLCGARADILIDQQPTSYRSAREGVISDYFTDPASTEFSCFGFDDFTLASAATLTSITVYGAEAGVPSGIAHLRIEQIHNHLNPGTVYVNVMQTGGEVSGDWTFDGVNG